MSKFCVCPKKLKNMHEENFIANYIETSGDMEVESVSKIFERSLHTYNVRYKHYLGDGDSREFKAIINGSEFAIKKLECIGHVQKRMGTRLRA